MFGKATRETLTQIKSDARSARDSGNRLIGLLHDLRDDLVLDKSNGDTGRTINTASCVVDGAVAKTKPVLPVFDPNDPFRSEFRNPLEPYYEEVLAYAKENRMGATQAYRNLRISMLHRVIVNSAQLPEHAKQVLLRQLELANG
jgi:hypothetical protein